MTQIERPITLAEFTTIMTAVLPFRGIADSGVVAAPKWAVEIARCFCHVSDRRAKDARQVTLDVVGIHSRYGKIPGSWGEIAQDIAQYADVIDVESAGQLGGAGAVMDAVADEIAGR